MQPYLYQLRLKSVSDNNIKINITSMIRLRDVNKTYPGIVPLHVLKNINLEIERGELVSIMGASGFRQIHPTQHSRHTRQLRFGRIPPRRHPDKEPQRKPGRRLPQSYDWLRVPEFQPHQLQERRGERGPTAILPGCGAPQTQPDGHGAIGTHGACRPCTPSARRALGRSETASRHCPRTYHKTLDYTRRRAYRRFRQLHIEGSSCRYSVN